MNSFPFIRTVFVLFLFKVLPIPGIQAGFSNGARLIPGDANCDGQVNVLDAIAVLNFYLGDEPDVFCFEQADVNQDGVINVLDAIVVLNIYMGVTEPLPGTLLDVDGNLYQTVTIGSLEWMAENLKTSRYIDTSEITTGLDDSDWAVISSGAYAVYDHQLPSSQGIESPEEMVAAYGKLYNWYAVADERSLCPGGWRIPDQADWDNLMAYLSDQHNVPNTNTPDGAGNALKAARQSGHPWGGEHDVEDHPRWNAHGIHYGSDIVGFSALGGGYRHAEGGFYALGGTACFWYSTGNANETARFLCIRSGHGSAFISGQPVARAPLPPGHGDEGDSLVHVFGYWQEGHSVRCVREAEP